MLTREAAATQVSWDEKQGRKEGQCAEWKKPDSEQMLYNAAHMKYLSKSETEEVK